MKREKYRLTNEDIIERAKKVHGEKYDYSKMNYVNKRTKVTIICPEHGEFEINPYNHIVQKQGCPICGKEKARKREGNFKNARKTKEQFESDLLRIFGKEYELVSDYINNKTKVEIYCHHKNKDGEEHGLFTAKPDDLIQGHGCKRCVHSLIEDEIEAFLQEKNIKYERTKKFNDWLGRQHLDFFLPDFSVAIECQGRQHFEAVDFAGKGKEWANEQYKKVKNLDLKKKELCEDHKIKIFYFSDEDNEMFGEKCFTDKEKLLKEIKEYDKNKKQRKNVRVCL